MPLYEYQCESCGARVERIQKFSDPPLETCESCGGALRKLLSSPAIQFKGSGWYITDYAKKTAVEGTRPEGTAAKSSETGKADSAKADTSATAGASGSPPAGGKD